MKSVPTSIILLVIAIALLYLAVTDKLSRILDAWDILTGKAQVGKSGSGSPFASFFSGNGINIPSIPNININPQVGGTVLPPVTAGF